MISATIVHAIPGRVRLRIPAMRANPAVAADVSGRLARIPGVRGVETNLVIGSVVVTFDVPPMAASDQRHALEEAIPGMDVVGVRVEEGTGVANGNGFHPDVQVADFLRSLNDGVGSVASGFDLKVLVPMVLFALGIRSLIVTDRLPFPSWYDYFWFGLSTFVMMNGTAFEPAGTRSAPVG